MPWAVKTASQTRKMKAIILVDMAKLFQFLIKSIPKMENKIGTVPEARRITK
jgi:hypothetical protein